MLGFFLSPYPDELFYSICARYSKVVKYSDSRDLCKELFGNYNVSAIHDLPCNLNNFTSKLPVNHCYTPESIINDLTLLPYYSPFLSNSTVEKTKQQMKTANCSGIHYRLGLMASRIKIPKFLKYCFECTNEDLKQFGETYWHRSHQLPGVFFCWKHKGKLGESTVRTNTAIDTYVFTPASDLRFEPVENTFSNSIRNELWKISNLSNQLLFGNYVSKGKIELSNIYKEILIEKNLATYTKSLKVKKIIEQFISFYPNDILSILGCELKGKSIIDNNWLLQIFRTAKSVQHPLYHILTLNFLNINLEKFFNYSNDNLYFGEPPWICLNTAASHYKQAVVKDFCLGSRSRKGKPVGKFSCDCGFEFIRSGPDKTPEDKFRIDKMVNFGSIWEGKLIELWNNKAISLTGIARDMNVDPLTIKRYGAKLGLPFERKNRNYKKLDEKLNLKVKKETVFEKLLFEKRQEWITLVTSNPTYKLKDLRLIKPKLYTWLSGNDSNWLTENLPEKKLECYKPKSYVDWHKRDLGLSQALKAEVVSMLSENLRPKQITKTALGKKTDSLALLLTKLDKLPLTKAVLGTLIESREEFAIRKIKWVANNFKNQKLFPSKSRLITSACVYKIRDNPLIKKVIDQELNRFTK